MKICYIWVKKFRNLENFGISLSSEHEFHYEMSTHSISRVDKNKLPDNFFYDGIIDVSALIGENGSGKSNCIELICMVLKGGKSRVKSDFIIITEDNGYFTTHQNFSNSTPAAYNNFEATNERYDRSISGINVIYFSNISDDRQLNFEKSVSNISINSRDHQTIKFSNQTSFISSERFIKLDINKPEHLLIDVKYYSTGVGYLDNSRQKEFLSLFTKSLKRKLKELSYNSQFSASIIFAIIFKILKLIISKDNDFLSEDFIIKTFIFQENERTEHASKRIFEACINHPACENLPEKESIFSIINKIDNNEFEIIDEDIKKSGLAINFILEYNNIKNKKLIDILVTFFEHDYLIKFTWWGLSSGHTAYLTLFSSIYCELKRTRNDAIVLIDEGDLYLHPKWQIEFLEKLTTVLPSLSTGNIQLVLTSHSPFLISDLPRQCITILKSQNNKAMIVSDHLKSMTFGANLYELYSDAFFLGSKRTGTFAQKKIEYILKKIDNNYSKQSNIDELINYTRIIGDKIINYHLLEVSKND
ncbi:AAA family ATPase [Shewanella xiamenensis]|uniref:AAA family ATPase n=3 Tax=Shewanella xiamenensis TaxID=332186 RepID=UPI00313E7AED